MTIDDATIKAYSAQFKIPEYDVLCIAAAEGFLRRAALVNGPFMLKGSYVTRQYLQEGWRRIPGDLDWVGLGELDSGQLTQWVTAVTETELDDGIRFRSFKENAFWRRIDYAMNEDFPTVNTDLLAWVGERQVEMESMDVSFGMTLEPGPCSLSYRPMYGEPFAVPLTCPLELQLAWKLHQCLVRPRFKDMLDLILLLGENMPDPALVWAALDDECKRDDVPAVRFNMLLDGIMGAHPHWKSVQRGQYSAAQLYDAWSRPDEPGPAIWAGELKLPLVYCDDNTVPADFTEFAADLADQLKGAGFVHVAAEDPVQASVPDRPFSAGPAASGIKGTLSRWLWGR